MCKKIFVCCLRMACDIKDCKILYFVDRASCNDSWKMTNVTHKFLSMYLFLFLTLHVLSTLC